jgi:membrane-bound serine protease (ClpP class)
MTARAPRIAAWLAVAVAVALLLAVSSPAATAPQKGRVAYSIELNATIDPATQKWISSALDDAVSKHAYLAIIRLDTPGGLDTSLRAIVKDMLAAPIPVVVYVSPNGSRAASAGMYITEAADVAAMAPETNIGSATPISIGPGGESAVLGRKIRNDAAAYVRALAAGHGRNPHLAERMVREAVNVTAPEAKRANLIDLIAPSETSLLAQLDGFRVKGPKAQTLHTAGVRIEHHDMPLQYDLLEILVNPTVSFLLITLGMIGLAIEILSPGLIVPGGLGAVSLLLGLYGTSQLPVTLAGILLIVAAIALIVAEAHLATHGLLGMSGVVALVAGGLLLYDTDSGAFGISKPVVIATGLVLGGLFVFMVERVIRARGEPVRTGWEEMVGAEGVVRVSLNPVGQVFTEGALWRARAGDGDGQIAAGDRVRVESVDGLTLNVSRVRGAGETKEGAE